MAKRSYDVEDERLIVNIRDETMSWSDKAPCGHTRADMLAAKGGSAYGGPSQLNLDTKCEACEWNEEHPELKPLKKQFGVL